MLADLRACGVWTTEKTFLFIMPKTQDLSFVFGCAHCRHMSIMDIAHQPVAVVLRVIVHSSQAGLRLRYYNKYLKYNTDPKPVVSNLFGI